VHKSTTKKIEDAPYSPIETKSSGEPNVEYYDVSTKSKPHKKNKQKDNDFVITQQQYGEMKAAKIKLEETGEDYTQWTPDPDVAYYTIPEDQYDPRYIHGPGYTCGI